MIINPQNISTPFQFTSIISLVPSITELLSDLGLEDEIVGITKFCIHPANWYRNKTRVGGTKNVNIKMVHSLRPDLIIANKEENERKQVEELACSYSVLLTDVTDLESAFRMIRAIGILTNKKEKATQLIEGIKTSFGRIRFQFDKKKKLNAAYLIWQKPFMTVGGDTFISNMMLWCGLENIFSSVKRYPEITLNELKERGCEIVLLSSEPYPFKEKHKQEIENELPGMEIYLADGEMFSWYGSRLLKAADYFESFNSRLLL